MADETTPATGGNFVLGGQVAKDLLGTLTAPTPTSIATLLRQKLAIKQVCDYRQQIAQGAADNSPSSLGTYISDNMRGQTSTSTQLKSATRLYFNPKTQLKNTSLNAFRRLDTELSHKLEVAYSRNLVGHLESLTPPFTISGNELTFVRPAKLLILFNGKMAIWNGTGTLDGLLPPEISNPGTLNPAMSEPTWRFTATGTNRTVTVQPTFTISGSLSTGDGGMKLQPITTVFQEQDIYPYNPILCQTSLPLEVLRGSGAFGRVEKLTLNIERTPYVAHFSQATDALGLFKGTVSGEDDDSNYVDLIEL